MTVTAAVIGADLGGTNLRLGLVPPDGKAFQVRSLPVGPDRSPGGVAELIRREAVDLLRHCRQRDIPCPALCLAAPGTMDHGEGVVVFSPNFLGWSRVPLREMLGTSLGLPVLLENDANAAAWGEHWGGAGRGEGNLVMFTLGTGVGGGVVADGRLLRGSRGMAGELGHLSVVAPGGRPCGCGSRGCLERYASATAMVELAAESWEGPGPPPADAREVHRLAREGNAACRRALVQAGRALGRAMAGLVNVLDPGLFVVGGGASGAWDLLAPRAEAEMRRRALGGADRRPPPPVRRASLGDLAGVVGAAGLWWKEQAA
jgi:glucokinase